MNDKIRRRLISGLDKLDFSIFGFKELMQISNEKYVIANEINKIKNHPKIVIDVGAGSGKISSYITDNKTLLILIEPDLTMAKEIKKTLRGKRYLLLQDYWEAVEITDKTVDLFIFSYVLQYIDFDINFIKRIKNLLNRNGVAVFVTTALDSDQFYLMEKFADKGYYYREIFINRLLDKVSKRFKIKKIKCYSNLTTKSTSKAFKAICFMLGIAPNKLGENDKDFIIKFIKSKTLNGKFKMNNSHNLYIINKAL
jgi:ubiquinone/menaquinone biosynthesis C-methylase UbiE